MICTRAGLLSGARQSVDRNLAVFKNEVSGGAVDADTLVKLRKYERLSYVMGTAVGVTLDFMDSIKKGAEIPKAVEALSNYLRALRLWSERLRDLDEGTLYDNQTQDALIEAREHFLEAYQLLSSETTGPMRENCRIEIGNERREGFRAIFNF